MDKGQVIWWYDWFYKWLITRWPFCFGTCNFRICVSPFPWNGHRRGNSLQRWRMCIKSIWGMIRIMVIRRMRMWHWGYMRWQHRAWGVMPVRHPSRVVVVSMRWGTRDSRGRVVMRSIAQFIRVVFRIPWWMKNMVCTPLQLLTMPVVVRVVTMGSPAVIRRGPMWWYVAHIKRCLGFSITCPTCGMYLRLGIFHSAKKAV